jgi:hypothetical protein
MLPNDVRTLLNNTAFANGQTPEQLEEQAIVHYIKVHLSGKNPVVNGIMISYDIHHSREEPVPSRGPY